MRRTTPNARRTRLLGAAEKVGRSLVRAAEWASDGVARLRYHHAHVGLSTHTALAGAVEVASLAIDLTASPAAAAVVALGSQALTLGIATDAAMRVTRRWGVDRERARAVLVLAIAHAEQRDLCTAYEAQAWRMACRLPSSTIGGADTAGAASALVRDGTRAVVIAALIRAVPKGALARVRWVPAFFRIAALPETLFAGARLVAAVEGHAELLCGEGATLSVRRARRGMNRGVPIAIGAMTRPSPRRTLAVA
jgi:hypothetical protein